MTRARPSGGTLRVPPGSLLRAAARGDVARARQLVRCGLDVNAERDKNGRTALYIAAKLGDVAMVRFLLDHGAKVDVRVGVGGGGCDSTPLAAAAEAQHLEVVKLLVRHGADVHAFACRSSILEWALSKGHKAVVTFLLQHGAKPRLLAAVRTGALELVQIMLKYGADLSEYDRFSWETALHLAVESGNVAMARLLLRHGADVDRRDKKGASPLHYARTARMAELLISKGAKIEAHDWQWRTPLHWAAERGLLDVAKILLGRGAKVMARDKEGRTPLHLAALSGRVAMAKILLGRGAKVMARDKQGRTPLHLATRDCQVAMVEFLLAKGADRNARDRKGRRPIDGFETRLCPGRNKSSIPALRRALGPKRVRKR